VVGGDRDRDALAHRRCDGCGCSAAVGPDAAADAAAVAAAFARFNCWISSYWWYALVSINARTIVSMRHASGTDATQPVSGEQASSSSTRPGHGTAAASEHANGRDEEQGGEEREGEDAHDIDRMRDMIDTKENGTFKYECTCTPRPRCS
jgi:hypothetical protein